MGESYGAYGLWGPYGGYGGDWVMSECGSSGALGSCAAALVGVPGSARWREDAVRGGESASGVTAPFILLTAFSKAKAELVDMVGLPDEPEVDCMVGGIREMRV
jgi:hypothetical protein